MIQPLLNQFVEAITDCLVTASGREDARIEPLVRAVLAGKQRPSKSDLVQLQQQISAVLGDHDTIDLVYGGATKIKEYVFEAPKLPEIRGASALLDWVNEVVLPSLWGLANADHAAQRGIVFASGGNILGFVPAGKGEERARQIEQCYTEHTLTANSVAVSRTFRLIELRYGRGPLRYWVDDFLKDWRIAELRALLKDYYYSPQPDDQEPPEERFFRRKTFGELVTLLAIDYYQRRSERPFDEGPAFFPRQPWDERCDSSDLRPAVLEQSFDDGTNQLSLATARKAVLGRLLKSADMVAARKLAKKIGFEPEVARIIDGKRGWDIRWKHYLEQHPDTHYAKALGSLQIAPAPDVHTIADRSGEIAMIYADGNNVGRLMATLKTPLEYALISRVLSEAAIEAVLGSLAEVLEPSGSVHPFEILTIGGDDLLLLVPGDRALAVALEIGQRFERDVSTALEQVFAALGMSEYLADAQPLAGRYQRSGVPQIDALAAARPLLGMSAGVVVARDNTPIFHLRNLSEELLKSAKKKARKHVKENNYGGAVDFMALRAVSIVADRIEDFRKQALLSKPDNRGLTGQTDAAGRVTTISLTARPYSWHELAGLLATVRALRAARVSASQLYRLREILVAALDQGVAPSVLEYLFARTRMQPRYANVLLEHIEQAWQAPNHTQAVPGLPPWMRVENGGLETIWADMLEIYDLAGEEQDHGPKHD